MTPIQGALRHPSVPIQTALCQRDFDTAPHFFDRVRAEQALAEGVAARRH